MAHDFTKFNSEEFKDTPTPPIFKDDSESFREFLDQRKIQEYDPLSPEALKLQAEYVARSLPDKHPLDTLRLIANNPLSMPKDRIAACKALMEYSMPKVPAKMEVLTDGAASTRFSSEQLSVLSSEELDVLIKLVEKMGGKK